MKLLFALLAAVRHPVHTGRVEESSPAFGFARFIFVILLASAAGAMAGAVPSVVGLAIRSLLGQPQTPAAGMLGLLSSWLGHSAVLSVIVAMAIALLSVGLTMLSSRRGSELAGQLTAALRIAMLRSALYASPRDVEALGKRSFEAASPPPGAKAPPPVRGAEAVKLAIARDAGLVADFAVAMMTGLPQALVTLAVVATELVVGGMTAVLVGGALLFVASRVATDRTSRRVGQSMRSMQHADTAVFASLGEWLTNSEDLRVLGARDQALGEFANAAHHVAFARRHFAQMLAASGQIKGAFLALSPMLVVVALSLSGRAYDAGEVGKWLLIVPLLLGRLEALDGLRSGLIERKPMLQTTLDLLHLPEFPAPAQQNPSKGETQIANDDEQRTTNEARGASEPPQPNFIVFEHVSFTPPGAKNPVVDDFSLQIPQGTVVGVCGRSGCGKSTLVRLLLRLDEPSHGTINLDGVALHQIAPKRLPSIFGVLSQASRPLERSVAQNLALGLDPAPEEERMRHTLKLVGLDTLADALSTEVRLVPPSLSGGEIRRLMLARMLLRDAQVYVLDEPEAGLPGATAEAVLKTVSEVAAGRTTLVVTHAPHLLRSTFNVVMDAGKVVATGTHEELLQTSQLYQSLLAEALKPK